MTRHLPILSDLTQIPEKFPGVLLDANGVFWGGNAFGLFPGAKETMERLVLSGKIVGILSNSTQLAAKEILKLSLHGLVQRTHFHFFITSGEVARRLFLQKALPFPTPRHQFWMFGDPHPKFASHEAIFKDTIYQETADLTQADFIYISIPHIQGQDQTDPALFWQKLEKAASYRLPMVCPNPDRFAHEGNPPVAVVRQGSIAKMYEEMGGSVFYIGKPAQEAYRAALEAFCQYGLTERQKILMVGDTPETDIRGANSFGMPSALTIKTGMMADRIQRRGFESALHNLQQEEIPTYFIERFADGIHAAS